MEQENQEKIEQKVDNVVIGQKRFFMHTALMPVLFWLVFGGIYYFFAYDIATIKFGDISDPRVVNIFSRFSPYIGWLMGLISMIGAYFVYLFIKLAKLNRYSLTFPILAVLMNLPWYFFARQMVYFENRYTDIARALIYYVGDPLLSATKAIFYLVGVWLVIIAIKAVLKKVSVKKAGLIASLALCPLLLGGCVSNINEWACSFFDDPDHCMQNAAVQGGNADTCAKIKGDDFESSGSNPPRDKCYLRIAENTGDLSVCDKIGGGPYSYTKEECILGASVKHKNPSGCAMLSGSEKAECASKVGPYVYAGSVIEIDDQIALLKEELKNSPDEGLQKQLSELEKKRNDYLGVMSDKNKNDYESLSDPMNKQTALDFYSGKIDEKTKDSLVALNDSLRGKGDKLSDAEYKALRDMLAYKNDPKNNIENMNDAEIVKLRWNEKMGNAVDYMKFWNSNPTTAESKYDEQLLFYERMLERQVAIDEGLSEAQQDFDRNAGMVKDYIKGQAYDKAMDEAKKAAFGELMDLVESDAAGPVTAVLGEAIDTVKKEAKSAEFRGLVRAYNKGMEEELAKAGGNVDKAHEMVTANLQKDPYMYEDKNSFAKYGNILENKDCDGSNPHCIKRDVFWKAMKKSYSYQHK